MPADYSGITNATSLFISITGWLNTYHLNKYGRFFWYFGKSDLSSVHVYSYVHLTRYQKNLAMFNWSQLILINL